MLERVIAHADMDAFYASVEQHDDPALRGRPVIVGGTGPRGVVTSASYEARAFGVHSAMPTVEARRLCPDGAFVPGRMERYVEVSRAVREVFLSVSPIVEPLSLDEAFLDLTGTGRLMGPPIAAARTLKVRMREKTGLIVSVGIAPNKSAAKILSGMSKPDGLLYLDSHYVGQFLSSLPVERLWGVGRVTLAAMHQAGIRTVGDLAAFDSPQLKALFGSMGPHLRHLAIGRDDRPVISDLVRKSFGEENTFEHDLEIGSERLRRVLSAHGEALGRRLRTARMRALTVTLKLKGARAIRSDGRNRYPIITRSLSLPRPTDDGREIGRIANLLLSRLDPKRWVRLAGVQVHNLRREDALQPGFFDTRSESPATRQRLNRALDALAARFGSRAVRRGITEVTRAGPTRQIK